MIASFNRSGQAPTAQSFEAPIRAAPLQSDKCQLARVMLQLPISRIGRDPAGPLRAAEVPWRALPPIGA